MVHEIHPKIPVHIIAGFLGSGKTTLMNRLLADPAGRRPAVIVNEIGKVPLDGDLLHKGAYSVKELASGCICCSLAGPLTDSLKAIAQDEKPDVILIEATGIAEPAALQMLVCGASLTPLLSLGNVVCIVDAAQYCRYEQVIYVLHQQAQQANVIVLNKTDLATAEQLAATRERIHELAIPGAVIMESRHCDFDLTTIYNPTAGVPEVGSDHHHHHGAHHGFKSFSLVTQDLLDLEKTRSFLQALPPAVVRAKGLVRTEQGNFQFQHTLSGLDLAKWGPDLSTSRLVFIGLADGPDFGDADLAAISASQPHLSDPRSI